MLEVADIVRAAGPEVCQRLAVLPSQQRALQAILQCRTPALGGQVYGCEHCGALLYSYHSCGNRHCPKCHGQRTERWLQKQRARLLPCPYYLVTFTLPAELRALARCQQKIVYSLLLGAAARSLQKLCADPQWMGAQPSLTGVLHTWTRAMLYHPHAHFLVSAGGLSEDGQTWLPAKNPAFLVPVQALSKIFRAKMRDGLRAAGLLHQVPAQVWQQPWVVHAQHAGRGDKVLEYLGRYVFRIAISQSRLESLQDGQVTFRYRDNQSQQIKRVRSACGPVCPTLPPTCPAPRLGQSPPLRLGCLRWPGASGRRSGPAVHRPTQRLRGHGPPGPIAPSPDRGGRCNGPLLALSALSQRPTRLARHHSGKPLLAAQKVPPMRLTDWLHLVIRLRRFRLLRGCAELLPRSKKNPFFGLARRLASLPGLWLPSFSPAPNRRSAL